MMVGGLIEVLDKEDQEYKHDSDRHIDDEEDYDYCDDYYDNEGDEEEKKKSRGADENSDDVGRKHDEEHVGGDG